MKFQLAMTIPFRVTTIIIYALHIIWTGLWRSVEAQAFKPNAFWFCLILGTILLVSAFLHQFGKTKLASLLSVSIAIIALSFYLYSFISNAEQDASFRVALVITSSIAFIVVSLLPSAK